MTTLTIGSRRACDNCGNRYLVKATNHRFCCNVCRSEFHRYGSPLLRLRDILPKEIERIAEQIEFRLWSVLGPRESSEYRKQYPARARHFEAMEEQQRIEREEAPARATAG